MIPKIIHYVWLGGKPLSAFAKKCIKSWKKFCPDYEIKQWDESNFNIHQNLYCKQAIEEKKWAFASDYIRLKVLYEFGGIYLDTDVEILKSLDDFLQNKAFIGFETEKFLSTAIIGAEKNNKWIETFLNDYNNRKFKKPNGDLDLTTNVVVATKLTTKNYKQFKLNNQKQNLDNLTIYPKDYFSPLDYSINEIVLTKNSTAIHHFNGSWLPKPNIFKRILRKFKNLIKKIIGKKNVEKIRKRRKEKQQANEK